MSSSVWFNTMIYLLSSQLWLLFKNPAVYFDKGTLKSCDNAVSLYIFTVNSDNEIEKTRVF